MNRTIINGLALLLLAVSLGARADNSVIEVKYEARQRQYVEDKEPMTDQMTLLVGERSSSFKSATAELLRQQRDSIVQAMVGQMGLPMQGMMMGGDVQMMSDEGYQVYKHVPAQGMVTVVDAAGGKAYRVEEPMPIIDWELALGDSIIAEYPCQKAVGRWRGRTWTAWYTLDLPYDDGPWKLCGLPGLILSARDHSGDFAFDCVSIKKGNARPIEAEMGGEKCTLKQLQSMKTRMAKDPVGYVLESMGLGGLIDSGSVQVITLDGSNGQQGEVPSRTPIFMEQP